MSPSFTLMGVKNEAQSKRYDSVFCRHQHVYGSHNYIDPHISHFCTGWIGFFWGITFRGGHPHPSGRGFLRRRVNLGIAPPCVPSGLMMFSVGTARGPYCSVGPHETWRGQVSLVVSWRYVDTFEESLQYSYQKG